MITKVSLIVALIALTIYLYGVIIAITTPEKNNCQMTYMFEYPQFVKIHFKENEKFPKYNLYAYSEGRLTETVRNMKFNGAPVIFVHGNRGSYKQARSFASVALRKGIDNNWTKHLDYFTVDFNEEYSAFFGGLLEDQKLYLELCIQTVLKLYKDSPNPPKSVSIVAHSMGGKIAQSVLVSRENAKLVNTIIALAAPIDQPVLNIDFFMDSFYKKTNQVWNNHRPQTEYLITNTTSTCCNANNNAINWGKPKVIGANRSEEALFLKDILLITIGGGSRDVLVPSNLTTSKFSDVHTMSTCVPNVWLTTDHMSSVWCLQQVFVVNRFLYSIIETSHPRHKTITNTFINDKESRKMKAIRYFTQDIIEPKNLREIDLVMDQSDAGEWVENIQRVFYESFKNGLDKMRVQMIRLNNLPNHQMLNVEAINVDDDDWVFGCAAVENDGRQRFCSKGFSLTHYVRKLPSQRYNRKTLSLDLHKVLEDYPDWTHVVLVMHPTKTPMQLNIDIYDPNDRIITAHMPSWYSYSEKMILESTPPNVNNYRIEIPGLDESYQALEIHLHATCDTEKYHAVAKVCVPWTKGFERFHGFTEENKSPLIVFTPMTKPSDYNTSLYPVTVDLTLDPKCQYEIVMKNSFGKTASRIVEQFSHWIPAHLTAILLLSFRHQTSLTPPKALFKCGSLINAYAASSTFFILTASRLFVKFLLWTKKFPNPDEFTHSIVISFVIHGSSLAILYFATYGLWLAIAICGNVAYQFLFKMTRLPVSAGMLLPAIQKFPITIGTLLISMVMASCGALPLICAVLVYFVLISKLYEDYLEEFVFKTAKEIASKWFGRGKNEKEKPTEQKSENRLDSRLRGALKDKSKDKPKKKVIIKESNNTEQNENENMDKTKLNETNEQTETNNDKEEEVALIEDDDSEVNNDAVVVPNSFEDLYNQLDPVDIAELSHIEEQPPPNETEEEKEKRIAEEAKVEAELDELMKELMKRQKEEDDKRSVEEKAARVEYDSIADGLSCINFHMTLFLLLSVLAALNIPTVLTWSRNYAYNEKVLQNDPSYYPAIASIIALSLIWQLPTPRHVYGYESLSQLFYLMAAICVIYCQDSIYRLSAIISSMFVVIALQQAFMPKMPEKKERIDETGIDLDLLDRVRRLREDMATAELKDAPPDKKTESLPQK